MDKRVITPATEELKRLADSGNSDFWITVERVGVGEAGNPKMFHITAYYTELAGNEQKIKERRKEDAELDSYLKSALRQTPANIRKIKARLLPEQRVGFIKETQRIAELMEKRNDIENQCSFAWVLLNNWLEAHEPKVEEIREEPKQLEIFPAADAEPKNPQIQKISIEDSQRWEKFIAGIKDRVGKTVFDNWFSFIGFVSFDNDILTVSVPTKFFPEYIEDNYLDALSVTIREVFGESAQLNYKIEKL